MTADTVHRLPAGHRLVRVLGTSAMSVVYLAEEVTRARHVAVKVLAPEVSGDDGFRSRFEREVGIVVALDHPNIVPIHAVGRSGGLLYLTMRYAEGMGLGALLGTEGRLGLDATIRVISQVAAALDGAHGAGLVHRDVRPANILRDRRSDHVYLSDFGIARHVSTDGRTATRTFVGTADYVAPEQIQSRPTDGRADIYALGGVAFRCLTGRPPYVDDQPAGVLWAHLAHPPPRISEHRPELSAGLDAVVATAMAKDPANRYRSCRDLVEHLVAITAAPRPALPDRRRGSWRR